MAANSDTKPVEKTKAVEDTISKVDDIAVGSDMKFQRKWWRFTNVMWIVFSVIVVARPPRMFWPGTNGERAPEHE